MIVAEVLGRRGQIAERVRIERLPFSIGRGYRSDLILEDRTVSACHAIVQRDANAALVLVDQDSENGTFAGSGHTRTTRIALEGDTEVRLGSALIRFRAPDHVVEPALAIDTRHPLVHWATTHWSAAAVGGVAVAAASLWQQWRSAYGALDAPAMAQGLLTALVVMAVWAGGWALFGRLLIHAARFIAHWLAICAYNLGQTAITVALTYARFLFAPIGLLQRGEAAATALLVACLLWIHLRLATALQARTRLLIALLAGVLFFAYQELGLRQENTNWVQTLPYWSRLQPIPPEWLSAETSSRFFERARDLRPQLDQLAAELAEADAERRP